MLRLGSELGNHRHESFAELCVELGQLMRLVYLDVGLLGRLGSNRLDSSVVASDPEADPTVDYNVVRDDGNRAHDCVALSAAFLGLVRASLKVIIQVQANEFLDSDFHHSQALNGVLGFSNTFLGFY